MEWSIDIELKSISDLNNFKTKLKTILIENFLINS
jgi:hypothetical protein